MAIYQTDIPSYAGRYGLGKLEFYGWYRVRQIHSLAVATYAPSTFSRDQLVSHGVPRVDIWGRGVDKVRFHPSKRSQQLHDEWAPNGEVVIGYMGRLAAEKRVADMTNLADIPNTKLVIVGDGPARAEVEKQLPHAVFTGGLGGEDLPVPSPAWMCFARRANSRPSARLSRRPRPVASQSLARARAVPSTSLTRLARDGFTSLAI